MRRSVKRAAIVLGAGLFAWSASSFVALEFLRSRAKPAFVETPPAAWAGRCEELRLASRDGESLGAWFVDAADGEAPTVVLLHGKGGARSSRVGAANIFHASGCATLLVTHRAHGDSSGEREDFGWSAREDVLAAVEWAEQRRPGAPIVVCGASLGGAAAVFAAAELGPRVAGYILECVYTDLATAAKRRCELLLPPVLSHLAFAGLRGAAAVTWPEWSDIAPVRRIRDIEARVLILAGGADRHSLPEEARALQAQVSGRAQLVILEAAEHDRLAAADASAYERAVREFLALLGPNAAPATSK
jgi:alpha-beta hydrolase superfamily lysophospholipase